MKTHGVQQGEVQNPAPSLGQCPKLIRLENEWTDSKPAEKNLGIQMDE